MAPSVPQTKSTAQLRAWLDDMFGTRDGFVYSPVGMGGRHGRTGGYKFTGGFRQHYFAWPGQREELVEHLHLLGRDNDVYVAPRLRSTASAEAGTAHDGRWLYADLDKPRTTEQESLLERLIRRSHYLIDSGTQGHLHLYVRMSTELPVATLTALSKRLAQCLNGDSKWQDNSVLRPPGTLNHKAAAQGGEPSTVNVYSTGSSRAWTVSDLERLLHLEAVVQAAPLSALGTPSWGGTVPSNFDDLMNEGAVVGERSGRTYLFVMLMIENGASYDEIVEVAYGHGPTADRGDVERQVRLIWDKHPHPGVTCDEVGCPNATPGVRSRTTVERTVGRALVDLKRQDWSGRDAARRKVVMGARHLAVAFGSVEFFISDREFAAICMLARPTLVKRLGELSDWIECVRLGDRHNASEYRLLARPVGPHSPQRHGLLECGPTWGPMADAFRYGGLGVSAGRIYNYLSMEGPKTKQQCAAELTLAVSTVGKAFTRLARHGLVEAGPDGYAALPKTRDEWAAVAMACGKFGAGERQEQRIVQDRRVKRSAEMIRLKSDLREAVELEAAARSRGQRMFAKFWALHRSNLEKEVCGAVEAVVQLGGVKTTAGGKVARSAQAVYEGRMQVAHANYPRG